MENKTTYEGRWVWVVIQNPGAGEQYLGQEDTDNAVNFIPVFLDKKDAGQCMDLLTRDPALKYEPQAIMFEEICEEAARNGMAVFVLDAGAKLIKAYRFDTP